MLSLSCAHAVLLATALLGCARAQDVCTEKIRGIETDITVDMESVVMPPGERYLEMQVDNSCGGRRVVGVHVVACDEDAAPRVSASLPGAGGAGGAVSVSVERRGELRGSGDVLVSLYCHRGRGLLHPPHSPHPPHTPHTPHTPRERNPPRALH